MPATNRKNPRILKRNEKIRTRFDFWSNSKGLKTELVLQKLTDEFLPLETETIWLIVSRTGYYKNY